MKIRTGRFLVTVISLVGVAVFFVLPSVFSANTGYPEVYSADANRDVVNTGLQPESSPLILSVKIGVGGNIDRVTVDLEDLSGARYFHPGSNTMRTANFSTPMQRVYIIDGEAAYLINNDEDEYEDNRYITAVTHRMVEGWAERTNKWQVEIADTGYRTGNYRIRVQAVNEINHASTAFIPLQIIQDRNGPVITLATGASHSNFVACPGEVLTLNATGRDDSSGIYSIKLGEGELTPLFGEDYASLFLREPNTDTWSISNQILYSATPGQYTIEVLSVDYAGNTSINSILIEVIPHRSFFQIELNEGWNLISVPTVLQNPSVEAVFGDAPVVSILTVIESQWVEPTQIEPGRGYLVKSSQTVNVKVDLGIHNPSMIPPMIILKPGWNLIGYAAPRLEPSMPLTHYLGADLKGKWIAIFTENSAQARAKSTAPYVWASNSFPNGGDYPFSGYSEDMPVVELGKGYWIYITNEGILIP